QSRRTATPSPFARESSRLESLRNFRVALKDFPEAASYGVKQEGRMFSNVTKLVIGVAVITIVGIGLSPTGRAFNPLPDPPGFGLVTLVSGQSLRVNVVCSPHGVGAFPPGPCAGELIMHDADGNTLTSRRVVLTPGQAASLEFNLFREGGGPFGIDPCWI